MANLRVGIIGAGHIGRRHAQCWARLPGATIAAIADIRPGAAENLAATLGGGGDAPVALSVEDLLADTGIDAVSICTPTDSHAALTVSAARVGKHILCEKPMALTVADCDTMIAAAQTAGVLLTIGQVVRFFPEYENARRLIERGAVGQPAMVRTRRAGTFPRTADDWYADTNRSGGVIFDLLVHDIDWLLWCFGAVTRVYAKGQTERLTSKDIDHLDYALLTLRHASGVISHIEGSWAEPHGFFTAFEVAGDTGLLSHDSRRAAPLTTTFRAPAALPAPPKPNLSPTATENISRILVDLGYAKARDMVQAWAESESVPFLDVTKHEPEAAAIATIPAFVARKHIALPVKKDGQRLWVAMAKPRDLTVLSALRMVSRCQIIPMAAVPADLEEAIHKAYENVPSEPKSVPPSGVAIPASPLAPGDDPFYRQIAAFARSIADGVPPVVTGQEARQAIAVAAAARESVRTGQAVVLPH